LEALRKFEGSSLDELLEHVYRECGAQARILEANRVRKGGVGGFFAREGYEVVVEPDPHHRPGDEPITATGVAGPRGRNLDVLDTAEEPDELVADVVAATDDLTDRSLPRRSDTADPAARADGSSAITGRAVIDMSDTASAATAPTGDDGSADGDVPTALRMLQLVAEQEERDRRWASSFDSVLDEALVEQDTADAPPPHATAGTGAEADEDDHALLFGGSGQRPTTAARVTDDRHGLLRPDGRATTPTAAPEPAAAAPPRLPRLPVSPPAGGRLRWPDVEDDVSTGGAAGAGRFDDPALVDAARELSDLQDRDERPLEAAPATPRPAVEEDRADAAPASAPTPASSAVSAPGRSRVPPTTAAPPGPPRPRRRAPATIALDLAARFARLPAAPPAPTGPGVIVVVGRGPDALAVAERLADGDRTGTTQVLLATGRPAPDHPPWALVRDLEEAMDRSRRPTGTAGTGARLVVAVDLEPGPSGLRWAQRMISALGADQVRMTVSSDDGTADVDATMALLGGVDVLDVVVPDRPVTEIDPVALLSLGAPVATVAGLPATAGLWAALALEHSGDGGRAGRSRADG
jgi:hypothetical protein